MPEAVTNDDDLNQAIRKKFPEYADYISFTKGRETLTEFWQQQSIYATWVVLKLGSKGLKRLQRDNLIRLMSGIALAPYTGGKISMGVRFRAATILNAEAIQRPDFQQYLASAGRTGPAVAERTLPPMSNLWSEKERAAIELMYDYFLQKGYITHGFGKEIELYPLNIVEEGTHIALATVEYGKRRIGLNRKTITDTPGLAKNDMAHEYHHFEQMDLIEKPAKEKEGAYFCQWLFLMNFQNNPAFSNYFWYRKQAVEIGANTAADRVAPTSRLAILRIKFSLSSLLTTADNMISNYNDSLKFIKDYQTQFTLNP